MSAPHRRTAASTTPPLRTPAQLRNDAQRAHVARVLTAHLAKMDAEIEALLAAARTASPMWIAGALDTWRAAKERRAGYEAAIADAIMAVGETEEKE